MSSMQQTLRKRLVMTKKFLNDDDVTWVEGVVHAYLWMRFEWAVAQRNRHAVTAQKLAQRLNADFDIVEFRRAMRKAEL